MRWHADYARLATGGDLGYTVGRWKVLRRDSTGEHAVARGKYLTVWRRQAGGSWKVLDVYLDGRPDRSLDLAADKTELVIDSPAGGFSTIELRGYHGTDLAACTRIPQVSPPRPRPV